MTTAIPLTLNLLVLIGLYELAAGFAGLTGRINWITMVEEFERSPALTFVAGFVAFVFGGLIIIIHNYWTDLPAIIVSAFSWIAAIEGLLIMAWPKPLLAMTRPLVRSQHAISIFVMLFGAALIILGMTGIAEPAQM